MKTLSEFDITYSPRLVKAVDGFLSRLVIDRHLLFPLLFGGVPKCLFVRFSLQGSGAGILEEPHRLGFRSSITRQEEQTWLTLAGFAGIVLGQDSFLSILPYNHAGRQVPEMTGAVRRDAMTGTREAIRSVEQTNAEA